MKTVVLGLFDDHAQAGGVLAQLASSPLDLETIEVVNHDLEVQRSLVAEHGLDRGRRSVGTAVGLCAMLGGVGGYILGSGLLASLGPLLTVAGGILLGALGGLALGLLSETIRVPAEHSAAVLRALEEGATAIVVRTSNVPTARAIGDLFRAGGSRMLDQPVQEAAREALAPRTDEIGFSLELSPEISPEMSRPTEVEREEDALFVPPWRRVEGDVEGEGETDDGGTQAGPEAGPGEGNGEAADAGDEANLSAADANAPLSPHAPPAVARFRAPSAAEAPPPSMAPALSGDADIVALDLTPRFARSLRDAGLETVGALSTRFGVDGDSLKGIAGIGPVAIAEVAERLTTLAGYRLGSRTGEAKDVEDDR